MTLQPSLIGRRFRYYGSDEIFTVSQVRRFSVVFACGHWCTDTVFADLIPVQDHGQLPLFTNAGGRV